MSNDPLPRDPIEQRVGLEAIFQVVVLELVDALVEKGSVDPAAVRAKLASAADEISKASLAMGHSAHLAAQNVGVVQRLADAVATRHRLIPQPKM